MTKMKEKKKGEKEETDDGKTENQKPVEME